MLSPISLSKGAALGLTLTHRIQHFFLPSPSTPARRLPPEAIQSPPWSLRGRQVHLLLTDNERSPAFRIHFFHKGFYHSPSPSSLSLPWAGKECGRTLSPSAQHWPAVLTLPGHLSPSPPRLEPLAPTPSGPQPAPLFCCRLPLPVPFPQHHEWYLGDTEMRPLTAQWKMLRCGLFFFFNLGVLKALRLYFLK